MFNFLIPKLHRRETGPATGHHRDSTILVRKTFLSEDGSLRLSVSSAYPPHNYIPSTMTVTMGFLESHQGEGQKRLWLDMEMHNGNRWVGRHCCFYLTLSHGSLLWRSVGGSLSFFYSSFLSSTAFLSYFILHGE